MISDTTISEPASTPDKTPQLVGSFSRQRRQKLTSLSTEIDESTLARDAANGFPRIKALRATGATVVLDGFGAGTSSIACLARAPIDGLKVDRSIVIDIVANERAAAACAAAVAMGDKLGLRVIAVGVETVEQATALTAMGCHQLQGFLFSRPVDSHTVLELGPTAVTAQAEG